MPFKPDSASGSAATRATKLTSVSSFKLYAYNSSGTAIADGITYTKSGNSWTTTSKVFWPQTGNVTFYAFSPASNSSVTFNTTSKTLTYTAPTGESSQQDVLYAYKTSARPTNNTVDLTFNHANAAFSVNARLATGCTATVNVSGVKLVNIKPTNTLTVSSGSASASGTNISTDVAINSTTLTTTAQTISSTPLMLPPQSVTAWGGTSALANTYLAVTCKVAQDDNYIVGSESAASTVYVPMNKALTKGQDNTVNLIFGSADDSNSNKRYYGRDSNGNRISFTKSTANWPYGKTDWDRGAISQPVDLGLSVNWAAWNIGAYKEDDNGAYFAYAAAAPTQDNSYDYDHCPYFTGTENESYVRTYSKYTEEEKVLEATDDAATANWGGTWRIPTKAEMQELVDNCTWTWEKNYVESRDSTFTYTDPSGVTHTQTVTFDVYHYGYRVTSKKTGYTDKSIFLPASGCYSVYQYATETENRTGYGFNTIGTISGSGGNSDHGTGHYTFYTHAGNYWVSDAIKGTIADDQHKYEYIYQLLFDENSHAVLFLYSDGRHHYRYDGFTIRPVCDK